MEKMAWFSNTETALIPLGRPFVKMHGLRNDFVIIDARKDPYHTSASEIIHICDRHEGVGADTQTLFP